MLTYRAPLQAMRFLLHEVLQAPDALSKAGWEEASDDLFDAILIQAARLTEEVIAPLNASGDLEGARLGPEGVMMPKGFRDAYDAWCQGGWNSLSGDPAYGGQGMPAVLDGLVTEMVCSASLAFSITPGLTQGAIRAIAAHGSDAIKDAYLPSMVDGAWSGAMALTEPQAGTDLGLLRTCATATDDGSFRLSGQKMFISSADHDMAENIVHLVLARLPDAPAGARGISLFLVPKVLPDGRRNDWSVLSIEDKMGLHGSPTCVVAYDGATGWLVGEPNRGLAAMFTMMNHERLFVGIQGVGVGESAAQLALAYAREREQGRAPDGPRRPERPADALIHHPDVRRMVLSCRVLTEAGRALAAWTALRLDMAHHHGDEDAEDWVALLTPVIKAASTDFAFDSAVLAQQVMGGHGYVREMGAEQLVRDVRITQIYEGANGVQALDLVMRKLPQNGGRAVFRFLAILEQNAERLAAEPATAMLAPSLRDATARLCGVVDWFASEAGSHPLSRAAAATDGLRLFALAAYGWMWAETALAAARRPAGYDTVFLELRIGLARFFMEHHLAEAATLEGRIRSAHAYAQAGDGLNGELEGIGG